MRPVQNWEINSGRMQVHFLFPESIKNILFDPVSHLVKEGYNTYEVFLFGSGHDISEQENIFLASRFGKTLVQCKKSWTLQLTLI